ncbi:MAG: hypothetical protein ACOXZS_01775 [Bacilli bacterium]
MTKYIKVLLFSLICICLFLPKIEAADKVNIYFFWGNGCPHCENEKEVLAELKKEYPITIYDYEVWYNKENQELLDKVGEYFDININGAPFTVIGNNYFVGFSTVQGPAELERLIKYYLDNNCRDMVGELLGVVKEGETGYNKYCDANQTPTTIKLPFWGVIDLNDFSLPIITIIFGALDGFNPCAMWVLIFLISTLLGIKDRKRMWMLGSIFILTSGIIYFLFMGAWLNLMLFMGAIIWIRLLIAIVAVLGGSINIKNYFTAIDGCSVVGKENRTKIFERIKKFTYERSLLLSVVGIILLAISVNFIELICSAGLPVVYTNILALNEVSGYGYYWYLLLYIIIFMFDDMMIFIIAMITLKMTGMSTKYAKYSHLVGGILMVTIGILLVLKPEWLMFG